MLRPCVKIALEMTSLAYLTIQKIGGFLDVTTRSLYYLLTGVIAQY